MQVWVRNNHSSLNSIRLEEMKFWIFRKWENVIRTRMVRGLFSNCYETEI